MSATASQSVSFPLVFLTPLVSLSYTVLAVESPSRCLARSAVLGLDRHLLILSSHFVLFPLLCLDS
jgi:hypothetical protein